MQETSREKVLNHRKFLMLSLSLPVIPDALKKVQGFTKSVLRRIFAKHHVIAAACSHENDGSYIIEALNPLPPFVPLASDIKHALVSKIRVE